MADEIDRGQRAGEVATRSDGTAIRDHARTSGKVTAPATLSDLGITSQRVSEWRAGYERDRRGMTEPIEDAEDRAALAALDRQEAALGRERARGRYLTAQEVQRLCDGASPLAVWRGKRALTRPGSAWAWYPFGMRRDIYAGVATG